MKYAAYCATRNLYNDMDVSAKSIIANSDVDKVFFFIEDDEFPHELPPIVETRNVSNQTFFHKRNANHSSRFTYMAMLRAALCKMLDVDKVLSLDCDTIAVKDCSHVWDIDISNSYFAATPEKWAESRPGLVYCNIGVALLNLEKLRDGKADEIISVLNTHYFRWVDQDAYNYLCQGRIADMDSMYNYCPWVIDSGSHARIVHYAAREDWRDEREVVKFRNMSWANVMELHNAIHA